MLEIKNIDIEFDHKIVLKNADFKAYQSQITIIQSKSGYGKTSLLNLMNDVEFDFEFYKIDDQSIDKNNVRNYVSMSPQTPLFINSLTMKDNILLYLSLNNIELDNEKFQSLTTQLHLENLLLQYPQSLSGGELRRISLVNQILLDKPVILLDEPTASLDEEYIEIIKEIVLELKKKNKMIIISTHDKIIQNIGDRIYEINNHTLNLIKEDIHHNEIIKPIQDNQLSYFSSYRILKRKYKYNKIKNSLMSFMMIVIVTLLGFSSIYGQGTIRTLNNQLNQTISNQMIVYKQICEATDDYNPFQVPLMKETEISYLKNHQYIQDMKAYHHGNLFTYDSEKNNITVVDNHSLEKEVIINENEMKITFASYFDDLDYNKQIIKKYNVYGVYISQMLADLLKIDENHTKIKFYLAIPKEIQSPGGYVSYAENEEKFYHVDFLDCASEYVEMNIAGIYRDGYMGVYEMPNANGYGRIYIENNVYEKYINKYKIEKDYIKKCMNTIICKQTHIYPYIANSYIVKYDIEHIEELLDDLYKNGYRYVNDYYDTSLLIDAQQTNSNIIRAFGIVMFIVGCVIMLSIKYVQREETKQIYNVLKSQSKTKKDYYKIMCVKWIEDIIFIGIVSSLLGYVLTLLINRTYICYTEFNIISVFIMFFISIMTCLIIPFISDYFILRYEKC